MDQNIIFFDSEFTSFDPYQGEILSLGMVKTDGSELYLELEDTGETSQWVQENVVPFLTEQKVSRKEAREKILAFGGGGDVSTRPHLMAYVSEYDTPYLYKLLNVKTSEGNNILPFHWIVLDFASILFARGLDPTILALPSSSRSSFLSELRIDLANYRPHHALDDARLLRDVYTKFMARYPISKTS